MAAGVTPWGEGSVEATTEQAGMEEMAGTGKQGMDEGLDTLDRFQGLSLKIYDLEPGFQE